MSAETSQAGQAVEIVQVLLIALDRTTCSGLWSMQVVMYRILTLQ